MLSVLEYEGILVVSVSADGEPSNIRSERAKLLAKEICCMPRQANHTTCVHRQANHSHATIPADILKDTRASSWRHTNNVVIDAHT